ncbi:MAG: acyl-CoA dehydrogenase family protein [Bdellovibrio sp.]
MSKTNLFLVPDTLSELTLSTKLDLAPLQKVVREKIIPHTMSNDKQAFFNWDLYKELHGMGVLTSIIPKDFGGQQLPVADLIWIARELSYGSSGCNATFIGNLLGLSSVVHYAAPELRDRICADYMKHFSVWSFAMTEAGAGSDLMTIATNVRETDSGFILNGEKNYITNGTVSSQMCVFARHFGKKGEDLGISCFFVPGSAPGVTRGQALDKIGWRESNTGAILFKNVELEAGFLLGKAGEGLGILTHCLNRSKTLLAASSVGIAYRSLDLAQERLIGTRRYGKPLLEQAAIRHQLARLHTQTEAAWLMTCRAAGAWDAGFPAVKESSMAKLFAGGVGVDVARTVMELFGARGFLSETEISKIYRDAKAVEIVEGPSLVQELLIAKHVLGKASRRAEKKDAYTFLNTKAA